MKKDFDIEEIFAGYQPELTDNTDFMEKLQKKLDAVELIRAHNAAQVRRYKRYVAIALVCGLVSGAVMAALVLSRPLDVPLFSFGNLEEWATNANVSIGRWQLFSLKSLTQILVNIQDNSRTIFVTLLSFVSAFGVFFLFRLLRDMADLTVAAKR